LKDSLSSSGEAKSKVQQERKDLRTKIDALRQEQAAHQSSRKAVADQLQSVQDSIKRKV
jgi:FtsZ-binding cell division protein ZapB